MKEEKYPKDFQGILVQFKNVESCRNHLFEIRWPDGYICPKNVNGPLKVAASRELYYNNKLYSDVNYGYENAVLHKQGLVCFAC